MRQSPGIPWHLQALVPALVILGDGGDKGQAVESLSLTGLRLS